MIKEIRIVLFCCLFLIISAAFGDTIDVKQPSHWSILFYRGTTTKDCLGHLLEGSYHSVNEVIYSGELAYALARDNVVVRFLDPLINQIQIAGNIAERIDYKLQKIIKSLRAMLM